MENGTKPPSDIISTPEIIKISATEKTAEGIVNEPLTREIPEVDMRKLNSLNIRNNDSLCGASFSKHWKYVLEETKDIFIEKLNGKILIDLGEKRESMNIILQEIGVGVGTYINIDKLTLNNKSEGRISIRGDMLEVMMRFADNSIDAVSINGIDDMIVDNDDYHTELATQIKRVLRQKGIVFGMNSAAVLKLVNDPDFDIKWRDEGCPYIFAILEKR